MRQVHLSENLDGQTLDASVVDARESLFSGCSLAGTVFLGDWRGTDYLNCTSAADWTQAQTYGSYWRGCTLTGALFPGDLGHLHHEPVAEVIRQRAALALSTVRPAVLAVSSFVLSDYIAASWDTSKSKWWDGKTTTFRNRALSGFRTIFAPYPQLAQRFEELVQALQTGGSLYTGNRPLSQALSWPDGPSLVFDAMALPVLPDPSRYALARWLEAQADLQNPAVAHHAFVWSAFPPDLAIVPDADYWWRVAPRTGY